MNYNFFIALIIGVAGVYLSSKFSNNHFEETLTMLNQDKYLPKQLKKSIWQLYFVLVIISSLWFWSITLNYKWQIISLIFFAVHMAAIALWNREFFARNNFKTSYYWLILAIISIVGTIAGMVKTSYISPLMLAPPLVWLVYLFQINAKAAKNQHEH